MTQVIEVPGVPQTAVVTQTNTATAEVTTIATVMVPTAPTVQVIEANVGPLGPPGPAGPPGGDGPSTVRTVTGAGAITSADSLILINGATAPYDLTLPLAATVDFQLFYFKRIDADADSITIRAAGSDLIDFQTTITLDGQGSEVTISSDGTQYWVLGAVGNYTNDVG